MKTTLLGNGMNSIIAGSMVTGEQAAGSCCPGSNAAAAAIADDLPFWTIEHLDLRGKTVFIRTDFNCPVEDGRVMDDWRIQRTLPTLKYALDKGAKVVIGTHLGRPKGKENVAFSLWPVREALERELPGTNVYLGADCVGDVVKEQLAKVGYGEVLLLENLRFHKGETDNDPEFARQLAEHADVCVDDAYGTAHRRHASNYEIMKHFAPDQRGIGLLMRDELNVISGMMANPQRPFVAVLGGSKVSDKLGVIEKLMSVCDAILIGGAMAFTFLKARGIEVGESLVEDRMIGEAKRIMGMAEETNTTIYLPEDHLSVPVHVDIDPKSAVSPELILEDKTIPGNYRALDIGPMTTAIYSSVILGNMGRPGAETIFWNGPMGFFENEAFANGTMGIAHAMGASEGYSVIGGGDSVRAVKRSDAVSFIDHISTGGGSLMQRVAGKELPALKILEG